MGAPLKVTEKGDAMDKLDDVRLYICDPNKNIHCTKESCYINGGDCRETIYEKFKKEDDSIVEPIKHGHWLYTEAYPHHCYCSVCFKTYVPNSDVIGRYIPVAEYCPHCGAKMDERMVVNEWLSETSSWSMSKNYSRY